MSELKESVSSTIRGTNFQQILRCRIDEWWLMKMLAENLPQEFPLLLVLPLLGCLHISKYLRELEIVNTRLKTSNCCRKNWYKTVCKGAASVNNYMFQTLILRGLVKSSTWQIDLKVDRIKSLQYIKTNCRSFYRLSKAVLIILMLFSICVT